MIGTPVTAHRLARFRAFPDRLVRYGLCLATAGLLALASGGCTSTPEEPNTPGPLPVHSFARDWGATIELKKDKIRTLYLEDELLFVTTEGNTVHVMNADSGQLLHIDPVMPGGVPIRRPLVLPETIVYPTNATLEIFDRKTGRKARSIDLERATRSAAVGDGTHIYIGLDYPGSGRLAAIDLTRRFSHIAWELMTFGGVSATPALFQNVIFIASEDGRVYAVTEERQGVWLLENSAFRTGGKIVADLRADDYALYVASTDGKLYALERATGKIKWQYYAGTPLLQPPVILGNTVYQYVLGTGLVAIDKTEGKYNREPKWVNKDAVAFLSQDDKYVYVRGVAAPPVGASAADGEDEASEEDSDPSLRIVALDKQTGKAVFASRRDDLTIFATNTKDSTIYAAAADGRVLAVRPVLKPGAIGQIVLVTEEVPLRELILAAR